MARSTVRTEITGKVWKVMASAGDKLAEDAPIVILESMKMETPINCPIEGVIEGISIKRGDIVKAGDLLATIARKKD